VIKRTQPEQPRSGVRQVRILGTPISIVSVDQLLGLIGGWAAERRDRYVVFRDVHGVICARNDLQLRMSHEEADIVAPDGMPLVWAARAAGIDKVTRVCGPDLLPAACSYGLSHGWRHYFYGGAPGVAEAVAKNLTKNFLGLIIAGTQCPPFRPLTREEDELACAAIRAAHPHLVWVGLGTPKQEVWMAAHRGKCGGAILLGVGAAFDIYAGLTPRAPEWAQKCGLEWSYRLVRDPIRLWRRYLVFAPLFVLLAIREIITRQRYRLLLRRRC
jgi:N-acetylglucosaminyldiphosphoundecaprenol N-acetyl-beta-D-mannosaminyltransferase